MMMPPFSVSSRFSDRGEEGRSTLLSLNWEAAGDDDAALLSLLEVLRPREEGHSTLLSLNREAAADDDAALLSLLAGVLLCHDVVAAHAQCKDEASEYTRFERHGNADTPELKSVPEWLEEKLAKTLRKNIKMLKNDTKFQAQTERANFCSFPTENVKDAQIETNSKAKLSKNMWLQTSN